MSQRVTARCRGRPDAYPGTGAAGQVPGAGQCSRRAAPPAAVPGAMEQTPPSVHPPPSPLIDTVGWILTSDRVSPSHPRRM